MKAFTIPQRADLSRIGIALVLIALAAFTFKPNAAPVPTPETPGYEQIVGDWEDQDSVETKGYKAAIAAIIAALDDPDASTLTEEYQDKSSNSESSEAVFSLYLKACSARRAQRMDGYLENFREVVYCRHGTLLPVYKGADKNTSGKLMVLEMKGIYGSTRQLCSISDSCRTPDVSFDGKRILFSARHSGPHGYRIFEMNLADSSVRQITSGYDDIEIVTDLDPIYLPNGNILFHSSRMIQYIDCAGNPVHNLFLCDENGNFVRRIGYDQAPTNYPQVLPSGQVVYCRWDYNDKSHIYAHALFVMNPDGTKQEEYYNNNSWWPTQILMPRPIPNTNKVMAMIGGYHLPQSGEIGIIDNSVGMQNGEGVTLLIPKRKPEDDEKKPWPGAPDYTEDIDYPWAPPIGFDPSTFVKSGKGPSDHWGKGDDQYSYPYPFDEETFLVCRNEELYFMKADGQREWLTGLCASPIPIRAREEPPMLPSDVDYRDSTGVLTVTDVYHGQSPIMDGIEKGTVKKLRVLALRYRAASRMGAIRLYGPGRFNSGDGTCSNPSALNNASWDIKYILGETPVHEDGSASFRVPARTPVFFQLIDEKGRMIQTMRSWATLQPGETFACTGCHESKLEATPPPTSPPIAMQNPPRELEPFYGPVREFSYEKEIQPILDQKCVECHNAEKPNGIDLRGVDSPSNHVRDWSLSYYNLVKVGDGREEKIRNYTDYVQWCYAEASPTFQPPYTCGSSQSPLVDLLYEGHEGVEMTHEEMEKICAWIDMGIQFAGWYGEKMSERSRDRIQKMLDLRSAYEADEREELRGLVNGETSVAHLTADIVQLAGPKILARPMHFDVDLKGATLKRSEKATLTIYDLRGRQLYTQTKVIGQNSTIRFSRSRFSRPGRGHVVCVLEIAGRQFHDRILSVD